MPDDVPQPPTPPASPDTLYDCIIVGGGAAGLAAAVYLGRYLRPTLVLDHKKPQTRWHRPIAHNVLGYPAGIHRNQLLDWGRSHIALYDCVRIQRTTVRTLAQHDGHFLVSDGDACTYRSRGLILAAGVEYLLPDLPDIFAYAGHSVWHCPECDGYKCIGKKIAVLGHDRGSAEMALMLTVWTPNVTLCTHGHSISHDREAVDKLAAAGIEVIASPIAALRGNPDEGQLQAIEFQGGRSLELHGAFANQGCAAPDDLLQQLPLELHKDRWIKTDHRMRTNIPRCYAAGDLIANAQTQLSVAMGTGATAAIWLHRELLPAELCLSDRGW